MKICRGKLRTWFGVCKGVLDMVGGGGGRSTYPPPPPPPPPPGPLTSGVTVFCSSITTFFRLSIRLATMVFWVSKVLQFPFWIPIYLCDIWCEFFSSDFQPAQRLRQLKRQGRLEQWFLGYLKSCFRRQSTVGNLHFFHSLFYIRIYVTESLWTFLTNNR